jgi:hypothetical protein
MLFVIEHKTGRKRRIDANLLQSALDSGGFSLAENQQILMDDGEGSIVKVSSSDYDSVAGRGGRVLTSDERMTVGENLMKEARYDTPEQRLKAGALGGARGLTLGFSDYILEGGDILPTVVDEQERKALEYFNQAESLAGEGLGMAAGLIATGGLGAVAKGGAMAVRGASSLGALRHAASPLMKAAKFTPAGAVGLAGRKASEATAKYIAKKVGAKGLANSPVALRAASTVAPLAVQGFVEESLIGGAQAAAEFNYDGNADDWTSAVMAAGMGGALGGTLGGSIALAPGVKDYGVGLFKKGLSVKPGLSSKANNVIEKVSRRLSDADAKTVKETIEGSAYTPGQIKKMIDDEGALIAQKPEVLAPQLEEIRTTGPRAINDLFFSLDNGIRKQAVDKIAPGSKGLKNLKERFDGDAFQEAYVRFDSELGDIAQNTDNYLAKAMRDDAAPPTVLGQELKKLHELLLPAPEAYDRVVKDLARSSRKAVSRLREDSYLGPVTQSVGNLLDANPNLPSHLADVLVEVNEKTRNYIYNTVGKKRADASKLFVPTREYFQSALLDRSLFGEASDFYDEVNGVYTKYADVKKKLRGVLPDEINTKSTRELLEKAQAGDGDALKKIRAYKELSQETDNYAGRVLSLTKQDPEAYAGPIKRNIKAYNSLENVEEVSDLVKTLSPSKQSGYISSIAEGVSEVAGAKVKGMTRDGLRGFMAMLALGEPTVGGVIAAGAAANLGRSISRAFRDPYKQLNRLARIEELKRQAENRFKSSVNKVAKSIGEDGQNAEQSMRVVHKASRVFMAELARTVMPEQLGYVEAESDNKERSLEKKAFASLSALTSDPALLDAKVDKAIGDFERSPQLRESAKAQAKASIMAIGMMKPKEILIRTDPLTGAQEVSGPDYAFDKMNQLYAVAQSPLKVVSSAAESKTLTREMASAFKALHPQAYTNFVSSIQESLLGRKGSDKVKYGDRLMLSTLFDIPMEASITAPAMSALQSTYQEEEQPEPRPQRGLASLKSQVDNTMTPSQRAMG